MMKQMKSKFLSDPITDVLFSINSIFLSMLAKPITFFPSLFCSFAF
jgi:hypothetical protein